MTLFLGVDGGGTKTEFVLIDDEQRIRARSITGTSYHLQVGFDEAVRRLEQGVAAICAEAAIAPGDIAHAFFGLPAYGEDAVIDPRLDAACGRLLGHARYLCGNDMICGWAGSLACEDGVNVVAGTGSIAYGERAGRSARAGGWGEMFSDEGSAYWIAIEGLRLFSRMSDGREAKGPLHAIVITALSLAHDLDLCARLMGSEGLGRDGVASLAPMVSQAAAEGDQAADAILRDAAQELAVLARAVRTGLEFGVDECVPVSWSGGVLQNEARVRELFVAALVADGFEPVAPRHAPGVGAALYACHLALQD